MQQQGSIRSANNQLSPHFQKLIKDKESQRQSKIIDFVSNVFEMESFESGDPYLSQLISCVVQRANIVDDPQTNSSNLDCFIVTILQVYMKEGDLIGAWDLGQMLANADVKSKVKSLLTKNSTSNQNISKRLIDIMKKLCQNTQVQYLLSFLSVSKIKNSKLSKNIGTLNLLISLLAFIKLIHHQSQVIKQGVLIKYILQNCQFLLKKKIKDSSKQDLSMWVSLCIKLEKITKEIGCNIQFKGYQFIWDSIITVFQIDNLQKRLLCLSSIDQLIPQLKKIRLSEQYKNKIEAKVVHFLKKLLSPRIHQQILSRSINFVTFWLKSVTSQTEIQEVLNILFNDLILNTDNRTSNLFSSLWLKLFFNVQGIRIQTLKFIYQMALRFVPFNNKLNGAQGQTKSNRKKQQIQQKNNDLKLIRIIGPLMERKLTPFEKYMEVTFEFLKQIWAKNQTNSGQIRCVIGDELKGCIASCNSPDFSLFIAQYLSQSVSRIVEKKQIKQNEKDQKMTEVYCFMSRLLFSLSSFRTNNQKMVDQSPIFTNKMNQIKQKVLKILTQKKWLQNIISCHNPENKEQLKELLLALECLIKQTNNEQFSSYILGAVLNKVNASDSSCICWIRNILICMKNNNLKKSVLEKMFQEYEVYREIDQRGLQSLVKLLLLYDEEPKKKAMFCFLLLKILPVELIPKATNIIIRTLWHPLQICSQGWLFMAGQMITNIKYDDSTEILIFTEIINISNENCIDTSTNQHILIEEGPIQQQINIRIQIKGIQNEHVQRTVRTKDSISVSKFISLFVDPLVNNIPNCSILNILKGQDIIIDQEKSKSLRSLGFNYLTENLLVVNLRNHQFVKIANIKQITLFHILNKYYGINLSFDFIALSSRRQLKLLQKAMIQQARINNWDIQNILQHEAQQMITNLAKMILQMQPGSKASSLMEEMGELLQQIDSDNLINKRIEINSQQSHRKVLSNSQYHLTKGIILLQKSIQEQQVGYHFLSQLSIQKILQTHIISSFDNWISLNISQYPYSVLLGLEVLWMSLNNQNILAMYIQSGKISQIIKSISEWIKVASTLNLEQKEGLSQLKAILQIIIAGLKIFNKILIISFLRNRSSQVFLLIFTKKIKEIKSLAQTKSIINENPQQFNPLIAVLEQDIQYAQLIKHSHSCPEHVSVDYNHQMVTRFILEVYSIFQKHSSSTCPNYDNKFEISFLYFQTVKLNIWLLFTLEFPQQRTIAKYLVQKLRSQNKIMSSIFGSILYIQEVLNKFDIVKYILEQLEQLLIDNRNNEIFCQIFSESLKRSQRNEIVQRTIKTLLKLLIQLKPQKSSGTNKQLVGILSIIEKNITKFTQDQNNMFLDIIMDSYLFYNKEGEIKALQPASRQKLYKSVQLCLPQNSCLKMMKLIKDQVKIADSTQENIKASDMGVGLYNLSNTCYMNSQLQLLHSIKQFVQRSLEIQTQMPILQALQSLFLKLSFSFKRSISPQDFAVSFDPPIDVTLQQDTTQFFVNLLDQLEESEKSGQFKKISKQLFKGQNSSLLSCTQCKKGKQHIQDFTIYSLAIQNQDRHFYDLDECLENAKIPQIIYDVKCENCKKQTKFERTTKIKNTPKYMFIQLRRLIFDYKNPYVKQKVHSKLEFPDQVTINEELFTLKGVITHSGTGQHGHYYTTLKENNKWIVYNDSRVYQMPENGRSQIWYGSSERMNNSLYSTNAYVLLYQKSINNAPLSSINPTARIKSFPTYKRIIEENVSLMTKQLLFGKDYKSKFVDFAFSIAILSKNSCNLQQIYEMLALITYPHDVVTSVSPIQYFKNLKNNENLEDLMSTVSEYKDHNMRLILNKYFEVREFFYYFLINLYDKLGKQQKFSFYLAKEMIVMFIPTMKQQQNFVHSCQYIKFMAFLIRHYKANDQFLSYFYEQNIIKLIIIFFKQRIVQIKMQYTSASNCLMQPFLEFLMSFLLIAKNEESQIIYHLEKYQEEFLQIKNAVSNDEAMIQLIFLYNDQYNYSDYFFNMLELNRDKEFKNIVLNLALSYLKNYDLLESKISLNFGFLSKYIEQNLIGDKKQFCQQFLGQIFPQATTYPILSLKSRTYRYLTTTLNNGFMEVFSNFIVDAYSQQRLKLNTLIIINNFLRFLVQFLLLDPTYLTYFTNLCAPIGMYGEFRLFLIDIIKIVAAKIQMGSIDVVSPKFDQIKQQLRNNSKKLEQIIGDRKLDGKAILCGNQSIKSKALFENVINQLFVLAEAQKSYWIQHQSQNNSKSCLHQFVDRDCILKPEFSKNSQLTKLLRGKEQIIEEEGVPTSAVRSKSNQPQKQKQIDLKNDSVHRKFVLSNITQMTRRYRIRISGKNMKNDIVDLDLEIETNRTKQLWVEKKYPTSEWGLMVINVDGLQQEIGNKKKKLEMRQSEVRQQMRQEQSYGYQYMDMTQGGMEATQMMDSTANRENQMS